MKKKLSVRILFYVLGFLIMTMGIAISVKSNLGVSPVSSIPYTITCVWGMEMGRATILFHVVLVILQILLLRREFKIKNLLQVPVGILFGSFTTLGNYIMTYFPDPNNVALQLIMMLVSTFFIAFGIFLYIPADFVPLAGEGAMLAVSKVTKIKFSTIKVAFDISMVTISVVICLLLLHSLGSVGIGTVIAAVLVGMELKLITKFFGTARDKILNKKQCQKELVDSPLINIMKSDVYTVNEDATLFETLKFLMEKQISGAPVINKENKLIGFVSDGDIMRYISSEYSLFVNPSSIEKIDFNEKLMNLMDKSVMLVSQKKVITVNAEDDLDEVCYILSDNHLKKAPVMKNDEMIGIINTSNITEYAVKLIMEKK